jgi:hypothetical protein
LVGLGFGEMLLARLIGHDAGNMIRELQYAFETSRGPMTMESLL